METISVSEFRKPKIFSRERKKIDANYFGLRISETENFPQGTGKLVVTISVSEFRKPKIFRREREIGGNNRGDFCLRMRW